MNLQDLDRASALAALDYDYQEVSEELQRLSELAARVTDTELAEVNLIDAFTQWTVAGTPKAKAQKPREVSICNYTIKEASYFESHVAEDNRFKNSTYVIDEGFVFYYGIPLKIDRGISIGSLCVAGKHRTSLSHAEKEQLHLVGRQVEQYLRLKLHITQLEEQLKQQHLITRRLAHDIRSPLSGIAQLNTEQDFKSVARADLELYLSAAAASADAILTLTDDILSKDTSSGQASASAYVTLTELGTKLYELYTPQATPRNIELQIDYDATSVKIPRKNLLPLAGNLIANAIKFTPSGGKVSVALHILKDQDPTRLEIRVEDNGVGIAPQTIEALTSGAARAQTGTAGETGYGLGLRFVKELCERQGGTFTITAKEGLGTQVLLKLPID